MQVLFFLFDWKNVSGKTGWSDKFSRFEEAPKTGLILNWGAIFNN
jgi:hypothetical protein